MARPKITRDEEKWEYHVEGYSEPFTSVTNIIKATVPKELAWWGMQVGCEGVASLLQSGDIGSHKLTAWTGEQFVALLNEKKLTTNHVMKSAGTRGTTIHKMLEQYCTDSTLPDLSKLSDNEIGYAQGLAKWLLEARPQPMAMEVMTASLEHRYAGTFDLRCIMGGGKHAGKRALVDLKTSKRVYKDQYFPQIEAYEHAEVELGEEPTDIRLIVHLAGDGKYREVVSTDTFEDFRVLLEHYKSIQRRKTRKRASKASKA